MKMNDERRKVIKELLDVTDREFTDEELIRQLTLTGITQRAAQDEKSTLGQRAENDYRVNLKNELIIDDLYRKLDRILENQQRIDQRLERLEQNNQRKEKEQHV